MKIPTRLLKEKPTPRKPGRAKKHISNALRRLTATNKPTPLQKLYAREMVAWNAKVKAYFMSKGVEEVKIDAFLSGAKPPVKAPVEASEAAAAGESVGEAETAPEAPSSALADPVASEAGEAFDAELFAMYVANVEGDDDGGDDVPELIDYMNTHKMYTEEPLLVSDIDEALEIAKAWLAANEKA